MNARVWTVATGLCLASLLGCSEEGHTPTPPAATVSVVPSPTSVVADGVNTVTLTVTDTGNGPIAVTASRGTFVGATTIAGASGTVVLRTCNAAIDTTCAGTAVVTATGANGVVGTASVTFGTLASLCPANCGVDDGCGGAICTRTSGTGICSSSSPSTCLVAGCTPTGAELCTGGVDEDCDGYVDCNDTGCAGNAACGAPTPTTRLGSLQIPEPSAQFSALGVKGSGWNELGAIFVQALDETGQPYPAGLTVRFEHRRFGGSTFRGPLAADDADCAAAAGCVAFEAVTAGSEGLATAYLYSGTVAGTLAVTATATAGGVTRTITLPSVAVVGAKANGANFAVVCNPRNVPALADTQLGISLVDAPITCAAILKDRYNNLLGRPTQVTFASEAAAPLTPFATTPAYEAGVDAAQQAQLGTATQIFHTLGSGLPFDVTPAPGEQSVTHALDGAGVRTHNPRDGVVTIVAIADGEEAFFDANGNGQYDAGEPFVDQGEPFVDRDDDGAHVLGEEWFLDLDGGGTYDGPNGVWDGATKIWTQTVVVYSAQPAWLVADAAGPTFLGTRWVNAADYAGACTATPAATPFAVYSAVTGPPPVGATSERYVVVASDWNLNVLHSGSSYEVEAEQGAKLKVFYYGFDSYADDLGFMYRYWPCDPSTTPATCASQCRSGTCLMTPSVSGFSCGLSASVTVKGGDAADVGSVLVDWVVSTPWDVFENSKFVEAILGLSGTSVEGPPPVTP